MFSSAFSSPGHTRVNFRGAGIQQLLNPWARVPLPCGLGVLNVPRRVPSQLEELGERGRPVHGQSWPLPLNHPLDRRVAPSRAGNSRPARWLTAPKLEVLPGEHTAAQPETGARSQQVLGEQLLGEVLRLFPETGLKTWI